MPIGKLDAQPLPTTPAQRKLAALAVLSEATPTELAMLEVLELDPVARAEAYLRGKARAAERRIIALTETAAAGERTRAAISQGRR